MESFTVPADLVRPRPMVAAGLNKPSRPPLYQAAASHAVAQQPPSAAAIATAPAPDATVVEPPPVPSIPAPVIDIPPPPVFNEPPQIQLPEPPPPPVHVHITDQPEWSISDRLINESQEDGAFMPVFNPQNDALNSLQLSDEELAARTVEPHEAKIKSGYLAKYAKLATSADTGGVLRW